MDGPQHAPTRPRSGTRSSRSRLRELNRRDYALGICLLLCVVSLWTLSNFVTQDLFADGYDKPFLVTYLNTSAFAFYLIPAALRRLREENRKERGSRRAGYEPIAVDDERSVERAHDAAGVLLAVPPRSPPLAAHAAAPPLSERETAALALAFALVWFAANWSLNAALSLTSVASATILSGTSGFFTLAVGRIFHVETLTTTKFAAVVTSFIGVILVSLSDSTPGPPASGQLGAAAAAAAGTGHVARPLLGDLLALLSALFYALYVTLLKVRIGDESRIDMQLFFGYVGLFNIVGLWPLGAVLHLIGAEPFELPHGGKVLGAIVVNMTITLLSDYMYVIAMLKTTPVLVTIGLSLTIPLAMVVDFLLGRPSATQVVFGALLVLGSFVLVGISESREEDSLPVYDESQVPTPVSLHDDISRRND